MKDVVIGLDLGTSSVKAAGFDLRGNLLARASCPVAIHSPRPGWVEQEPAEMWQAARATLQELWRSLPADRVAALGLSGQCPTHVLVDADHCSIGKAILWQDTRAVQEAAWLEKTIPVESAVQWVGSSSLSDPTCPPARLLWLKEHRREDWSRAVSVLQPKDFVALQLTGVIATDRLSAYCLLNPASGQYEIDYFKALGLSIEKMPDALKPEQVIGKVTAAAAQLTGLTAGTPVVIGTIDAYCDNLAGGIIQPGRAVDVAGTSEIISLNIEKKLAAEGIYPAELGGSIFLCGPMQSGGDTLRWLFSALYANGSTEIDYHAMEMEASLASAGCEGLVFLPYLNGERAPIWDAQVRGAFVGLGTCHARRHLTRAVYESIGFAIRHILEIAEAAAGGQAAELVVCGGGSRSRFWNQLKADILQRPVRPAAVTETGCLGAAILACAGTGLTSNLQTACREMILFMDPLLPDTDLQETYAANYKIYRSAYPAIRSIQPVLAGNGGL